AGPGATVWCLRRLPPLSQTAVRIYFPRKNFPWLSIWEANNPDMLTRGMEFSNTPTHGTMKALVKAPELFGVPAYEWLDAKGKIAKRFAAFSARVTEDSKGVADVRVAGSKREIVARGR